MPKIVIEGSGPDLSAIWPSEDQRFLLIRLLTTALVRLESEVVIDDQDELDLAA